MRCRYLEFGRPQIRPFVKNVNMTPNTSLQRTHQSVTLFAVAKRPPLQRAAELWTLGGGLIEMRYSTLGLSPYSYFATRNVIGYIPLHDSWRQASWT